MLERQDEVTVLFETGVQKILAIADLFSCHLAVGYPGECEGDRTKKKMKMKKKKMMMMMKKNEQITYSKTEEIVPLTEKKKKQEVRRTKNARTQIVRGKKNKNKKNEKKKKKKMQKKSGGGGICIWDCRSSCQRVMNPPCEDRVAVSVVWSFAFSSC